MHTIDGTYVPERSAASGMKRADGMLTEDGKLALAADLYALDETEVTDNDPRLIALLADYDL